MDFSLDSVTLLWHKYVIVENCRRAVGAGLEMIFRVRHFALIASLIAAATVAAWVLGFVPLIYMMPLFALGILQLSFACPRCNESPYVRCWGPARIGFPWPPARCSRCGFDFKAGL
ncbi:MAG TPA: hypothetical protein VGC56_06255 [Allosphingosinicella sp.]